MSMITSALHDSEIFKEFSFAREIASGLKDFT